MSTTRREFLRGAAAASAAAVVPAPVRALTGAAGGRPAVAPLLPPASWPVSWLVDVDGNGSVNRDDRRLIEASLGATRGLALSPRPGYDHRADLLGRGRVTGADLELFDSLAAVGPALPRPLVMCWHYGWYHPQRRVDEKPTARYLGGDYRSDDPAVEETFDVLKNEFGISADLLSWVTTAPDGGSDQLANYERGYFAAPSAATRRFGWLYETAINLGASRPVRLAPSTGRPRLLERHFRQMARRMLDAAGGALADNVLRIDGRPVVYMFASHLLGTDGSSLGEVGRALDRARDAFIDETGTPPFWIGDEALFTTDAVVSEGRLFRSSFFDIVTRYHHYEASVVDELVAQRGEAQLDDAYLERVLDNERRTAAAFTGARNRYTGASVLVMPSSAAGFAKSGLPTLRATRAQYARFLRAMLEITEENMLAASTLVTGAAPGHDPHRGAGSLVAPPVIVGSWNEEFEGHALFPARRNAAMVRRDHGGFEWLMALKEVFGWNHHAGDRRRPPRD